MTDFTPIQIFGIVMASLIAAAILAIFVRQIYKLVRFKKQRQAGEGGYVELGGGSSP